jgi:hypothetical protein
MVFMILYDSVTNNAIFFEKIYIYQQNYNKALKMIFILLAKINKLVLPRYSKRNLNKLSKLDLMIIGYRYLITKRALRK